MTFMTWNPRLSVKVAHFDDQHKQLLEYMNKLHDSMVSGTGSQVLADVLNKLVEYTSNHFKEEEKMMELYAYPERAAHKLEHEQLGQQVLELKQKYSSGQNILTITVMMFLKSWLMDHIQVVDKKYGDFFNNCGVT